MTKVPNPWQPGPSQDTMRPITVPEQVNPRFRVPGVSMSTQWTAGVPCSPPEFLPCPTVASAKGDKKIDTIGVLSPYLEPGGLVVQFELRGFEIQSMLAPKGCAVLLSWG